MEIDWSKVTKTLKEKGEANINFNIRISTKLRSEGRSLFMDIVTETDIMPKLP